MIEQLASIQRNSKQPSTKMSQFWFSQGSKVEVKDNMLRVIITRKKEKESRRKINYQVIKFDFFLLSRSERTNTVTDYGSSSC